MLSWQTRHYYKTVLICLNSILEMQGTRSVKSLSVVGFHTHKHTYIHTTHVSGSLCSWNTYSWTLIDRLDHVVYRGIVYTVYLLDVLVESHTAQLLLDYYWTRIEASVLGGGGWWWWAKKNVYYKLFGSKNVPRVLIAKQIWGGGGRGRGNLKKK